MELSVLYLSSLLVISKKAGDLMTFQVSLYTPYDLGVPLWYDSLTSRSGRAYRPGIFSCVLAVFLHCSLA